ncbi:MAG: hypothetical protein ACI9YE_003405 [Psychroserpens sp.]|jgi:hypothetical protein
MFVNLNVRKLKHLNVYSSLFIDELRLSRIGNPDEHNFYNFKIGSKLNNWLIVNLSLLSEFTHTNPLNFKHRLETLTFESNRYNLGHYLTKQR